uniref:Uncharacterized protein n=1 Tax=Oryza rufipogon TaxID=4529 RepID=A0A0E0MS91_ORYRU
MTSTVTTTSLPPSPATPPRRHCRMRQRMLHFVCQSVVQPHRDASFPGDEGAAAQATMCGTRSGSGSSGARTDTRGSRCTRPPPPSPTVAMSSTVELFHNGQIHPMRLPPLGDVGGGGKPPPEHEARMGDERGGRLRCWSMHRLSRSTPCSAHDLLHYRTFAFDRATLTAGHADLAASRSNLAASCSALASGSIRACSHSSVESMCVDWPPLLLNFYRDASFLLVSLAAVAVVLAAGEVTIWGALAFTSLYVVYVVAVAFTHGRSPSKGHDAADHTADAFSELCNVAETKFYGDQRTTPRNHPAGRFPPRGCRLAWSNRTDIKAD